MTLSDELEIASSFSNIRNLRDRFGANFDFIDSACDKLQKTSECVLFCDRADECVIITLPIPIRTNGFYTTKILLAIQYVNSENQNIIDFLISSEADWQSIQSHASGVSERLLAIKWFNGQEPCDHSYPEPDLNTHIDTVNEFSWGSRIFGDRVMSGLNSITIIELMDEVFRRYSKILVFLDGRRQAIEEIVQSHASDVYCQMLLKRYSDNVSKLEESLNRLRIMLGCDHIDQIIADFKARAWKLTVEQLISSAEASRQRFQDTMQHIVSITDRRLNNSVSTLTGVTLILAIPAFFTGYLGISAYETIVESGSLSSLIWAALLIVPISIGFALFSILKNRGYIPAIDGPIIMKNPEYHSESKRFISGRERAFADVFQVLGKPSWHKADKTRFVSYVISVIKTVDLPDAEVDLVIKYFEHLYDEVETNCSRRFISLYVHGIRPKEVLMVNCIENLNCWIERVNVLSKLFEEDFLTLYDLFFDIRSAYNQYFYTEDGGVFSADHKVLFRYIPNEKFSTTSLTVPFEVEIINRHAFSNCNTLPKVIVPKTVKIIDQGTFERSGIKAVQFNGDLKEIPDLTFAYCESLISTNLPDSVEIICWMAFFNCKSLLNVVLPKSLKSIDGNAFNGCESIKSIVVPSNVTTIGEYAFANCTNLESAIFEGSIEFVGGFAFSNCEKLKKVIFKGFVDSIGPAAFSDCYALEKIDFSSAPANFNGNIIENTGIVDINSGEYHTHNGVLYCGNTLVHVPNNVIDFVVEEFVSSIGESAFAGCSLLKSITFASKINLKSVGSRAFARCEALKSIDLPNSTIALGERVFDGCSNLVHVALPSTIEKIDQYIFMECSSLIEIQLSPALTTRWNDYYNCPEVVPGNDKNE